MSAFARTDICLVSTHVDVPEVSTGQMSSVAKTHICQPTMPPTLKMATGSPAEKIYDFFELAFFVAACSMTSKPRNPLIPQQCRGSNAWASVETVGV